MPQDPAAFRRHTRYLRCVTSQLGWGFPGLTRTPYGFLLLLAYFPAVLPRLDFKISIWVYMIPSLVIAVGCFLAAHGLRRYYARRFGRILSDTGKPSRSKGFLLLLIPIAGLVYLYLAQALKVPFYATGLLLALYYLRSWFNSDGLRVHRGIAAGLMTLLSLLPVWGLISMSETVDLTRRLLALELIFGGLADHILLVRSFRALSTEIHEHTVPRAC